MRSLTMLLAICLATVSANGQQATGAAVQTAAGTVAAAPPSVQTAPPGGMPDHLTLLQWIGLYEQAERSGELSHVGTAGLVKFYYNLGGLYEEAGMYPKAEDAMRREIAVLKNGPKSDLAEALGHLAVVHVAMGDLRTGEKEQLEALRIRESLGDPIGIALSWDDLADIYVKKREFKKSVDYAQKAVAVLADNPNVDMANRLAVRQTLAFALCGVKQCDKAIQLLKETIEISTQNFGANSLAVGIEYYLLGFTAWQAGDMQDAGEWMGRGTTRMKVEMGWGHSVYLHAMSEYARFLRQRGQMEEAASAEREVRMAQSVVDVHTLSGGPAVVPSAGLR
jgi:tetratricopeptide (TPR) repeat protein